MSEEYAEGASATWRLEADDEDRPDEGEDWEDEEDWDDDEWDDDEEDDADHHESDEEPRASGVRSAADPSPQSNSCTAAGCCSPTTPVVIRALA